jgi:hypothetical protein
VGPQQAGDGKENPIEAETHSDETQQFLWQVEIVRPPNDPEHTNKKRRF